MSPKFAKYLVLGAAAYNASALVVFLVPGGFALFGVKEPYSPFWVWLPSLLALFASITLFLSSRDLAKHGAFPYYNGLVRVTFAVVAFLLDFGGSTGIFITVIAVGDLVIGLLCIFLLPIALRKPHKDFLLNQF
jgi:hypothetical protein